MTVTVRKVEPEDWRDWRHLRQRSLSEDPDAFASSVAMWTGANDTEERWRMRLRDGACFIAYDGGSPVGMVAGKTGEVNELTSMWVAPEARHRGIGSALIESVLAWNGEQPLRLRVIDGNAAAISVYQHHEFVMLDGSADNEGCRAMVWDHDRREALS